MSDHDKKQTRPAGPPQARSGPFSTDPALEPEPVYDAPPAGAPGEPPGEFPFTRGIRADMYRGRLWTMRQYAGFGTASETNRRFRFLLSQGQTGLSTAFDLPTQMGFDSDHPMAEGEVGRSGVAIDSIEDMERLLEGLPLDKVSTSMTINATAPVLLALYVAVARRRGIAESSLAGTVQNDILKEYAARGTYIYPPAPSMRLVTSVLGYCSEHMPRWNGISVSGYHIREAGSTAVQEVAFTLSNGVAYIEAAREAGLDPATIGRRVSFFFNAHNNLLEEVAKFRAARRLWAKIMRHRFGCEDARSAMMRFHTQTAGSTLTAQQPQNNAVRVALQALAAVLGGTQSLHTNALDEALALPTEETALIALRTQQIIAFESGAADVADPLGGSYYVESMTSRIEEQARALIDRIDAMGGAVKAIERGFVQKEIQDSAYRYQQEIEN
ncbi:MAG TPA: methylmalonyl-CoA mutase family protein, partial [Candidatus Saccharimonadales bacterium]|nr:methylmalonyl-CoA mutase family protein [Candidatus Saccharimonadales bacterium]